MKTYRELDIDGKTKLSSLIDEVIMLLPVDNTFFLPEKIDSQGNSFLKTKQDYDKDKNEILRIIEEKRKDGLIDKEKSKLMKYAVTTLFNEFIRISPRKIYEVGNEKESKCDDRVKAIYNGMVMNVGELFIKIGESYVKIPEKVLYKVMDIPGNDEMQSMQYFITEEKDIKYLNREEGENYGRK